MIKSYDVKSTYSDLLADVLSGRNLDFESLTNEELYYAIDIADIFPDLLDKDALKSLYQRQQFFKQFEKITRDFAGREKELKYLNNYVDWLPKSSLKNKIGHNLRNIIKWHDKPPLLIKGIGGIGKSAIVARFILNQNKGGNNQFLPFIYIDFDLPGFSLQEPLTILIEALRQINIQFPKYERLLKHISERITYFD